MAEISKRLRVFNRQQYAVNRGGVTFPADRWTETFVHSDSMLRQIRACVYLTVVDITNTPEEQVPALVDGQLAEQSDMIPMPESLNAEIPAADGANGEGGTPAADSADAATSDESEPEGMDEAKVRAKLEGESAVALRAMAKRMDVKVASASGKPVIIDSLVEDFKANGLPEDFFGEEVSEESTEEQDSGDESK